MSAQIQHGLRSTSGLNPADRAAVQALATICNQHEGLDLKLNLTLQPATPDDQPDRFFYYAQGSLVGFLSLDGPAEVEICGMVHPDYRRQGIGRRLLQAAAEICQQRQLVRVLVICEAASRSGKQFLEGLSALAGSAEYRMELYPAVPASPARLHVYPATENDAPDLIRISQAAFDHPFAIVERSVFGDLRDPEQQFYLGALDGTPITSLRVFYDQPRAYIYGFSVLPELQGQGYGRDMLEQTIAMLHSQSWSHILLEVDVDNAPALTLYRSCGFTEVTRYDYHILELSRVEQAGTS